MKTAKEKIHEIADYLIIEHTVFNIEDQIHNVIAGGLRHLLDLADQNDSTGMIKFTHTTKGAINTFYSFETIKKEQFDKFQKYFDDLIRILNKRVITETDIKKSHYEEI